MIGVLPGDIRLLVLSREAPPSAFARAQTYDLVALVEADRLRLTADEGMGIARLRRPEQDLHERNVLSLLDRADGWAAGFVLLLRRPADAAWPSDVLFDYFAREVLEGVDAELRDFLLLTAWLPSMTAEMAQRLTGRADVERLLRALLHGNYPVSHTATGIRCTVITSCFASSCWSTLAALGRRTRGSKASAGRPPSSKHRGSSMPLSHSGATPAIGTASPALSAALRRRCWSRPEPGAWRDG